MKKPVLILSAVFLICFQGKALNVTIIESQNYNSGYLMDSYWRAICQSMGHVATIYPATKLDAIGNLSATDILIVSSALDPALTVARTNVIQQYLLNGGKVYIQSEYQSIYPGNVAYQTLVNALGGTFSWTGIVSGTLSPTKILGSFAMDYAVTTPLPYFWYGQSISPCSTVEMLLEYQGNYLGSTFCVPSSGGRLITTSDQDWINQSNTYPASDSLMKNIVYNLAKTSYNCINAGGTVSVNLGNDTTLCGGNTLTLSAGAGYSAYLWKGGQTSSSLNVSTSGTYWVRVTSSCGSTATDTINVAVQPCNLPVANLLCSDSSFCANNCIQYTDLSTNNPTSWLWTFQGAVPGTSTDQNPKMVCYLSGGSYDVSLIATNSNGSDTISFSQFISVFDQPFTPTITQSHDTLYCSYDPSYVSYQWYFNSSIIPGETNSYLKSSGSGNYNVQVTDSNGCSIAVGTIILAVKEENGMHGLSFSPNPASHELLVKYASVSLKSIDVYNMLGELVASATPEKGPEQEVTINIEALPKGVYFVRAVLDGAVVTARFLKE